LYSSPRISRERATLQYWSASGWPVVCMNVKINGVGFQRQVTDLSQIVPADKTDATAGGPEDDDFLTVGIVKLAAHFLLQALADSIGAGVRPADIGGEENGFGMLRLAGTHVHYPHQLPLAGRFQDIPQSLDVD